MAKKKVDSKDQLNPKNGGVNYRHAVHTDLSCAAAMFNLLLNDEEVFEAVVKAVEKSMAKAAEKQQPELGLDAKDSSDAPGQKMSG